MVKFSPCFFFKKKKKTLISFNPKLFQSPSHLKIFMSFTKSSNRNNLSEALRRIEQTAPQQTADDFTFSNEISTDLLKYLFSSYNGKDINMEMGEANLTEIYAPIVEKFLRINPPLAPFEVILFRDEIISMLQYICWIVTYDLLSPELISHETDQLRRTIYDDLSINFSQLQKRLMNSTLTLSARFLELWCEVVCAAIFTLFMSVFQETPLYRNAAFFTRYENDIRTILVGFSSPNLREFHKSILNLIPNEYKICVPKLITIGGEDYSKEFTTMLTFEPQIEKSWKARKSTLFQTSSTTGLMQNAMKLKGANITTPRKSRSIRRGNAERSGVQIAKAQEVLKNTKKIIKNYKIDRHTIIRDLCAQEELYFEINEPPPQTPLGVTFEDMPPPRIPQDSFYQRSPRNNRNVKKVKPTELRRHRYRVIPEPEETMRMIASAHEYLAANNMLVL
ncbi:hypothetical protein TRFO_14448 [Tritrichomonas foetus]|uniref:Uncharacterized protein n=1 Tax=Tritrichomonas foetus TaxID=1144522 RepID=A0A1J4KUX0_9EUKA|nr:hypothetical protein TRFO_14448 [Tritrichomonas foetus]|eukprot:OHT15097.1 hypothetical protein TRFO_14448 [Tritrichomonas foetus]